MTPLRLIVGLTLLLGGCGLGHHQVPQDVRALAEQGMALRVDWRVQVGGSELFGADSYERGGVAVSEDGRVVVATTSRGHVMAFDAVSGDTLWTAERAAEPFAAPPSIANGVVYVAVPTGEVSALYLQSGGEVWTRRLGDVFHSAPVPAGERVYVNSATGHLYALDRSTGQRVWTVDRQPNSALTISGGGRAAVIGDTVYAGFPDGSLAAIGRGGEVEWLTDLAAGEERLRDVDTTPLVADGSVYAASFSGGLHRVSAASGAVEWRSDMSGATSPLAAGNALVTSTADGRVLWVDPATGELLGELELDGDAAGEMVRWGDNIVLTESHDGLYVLASSRPWIHARFHPDTGFSNAACVYGSRIWALSDGGFVYGLNAVVVGTER